MWFLWFFIFTSTPILPSSGHIVKGDLRVYRAPVITQNEAGTIRGKGHYAILERGERCAEGRWWKISPFYWVCSGWFVPGTEKPGGLEDWAAAVPVTGWLQGTGKYSFVAATPNALRAGHVRRLRMLRGFFPIREVSFNSRKLFQLASGLYIDASTVEPFLETPLQGVGIHLTQLPAGFVVNPEARFWKKNESGVWEADQKVDRYSFWFFSSVDNERAYLRTQPSMALLRADIRVATTPPSVPPEVRSEDEPWVDVDLANNILYAFKGQQLVRIFLVSAATETPKGLYRIYWKQDRSIFDRQQQRNAYYLESVPFVMYFKDAYALHGAYWHNDFGINETHGCINLSPLDARWLFSFLWPTLPPGYASLRADARTPGSWVRLRR